MSEVFNLSWNVSWSFLIPLSIMWSLFIGYGLRELATIKYGEIVFLLFCCTLPLHGLYLMVDAPAWPLYAVLLIIYTGLLFLRKDNKRMGSLSKSGYLRLLSIGRKDGILIKDDEDFQHIDTLVLSKKEYSSLKSNKKLQNQMIEALRYNVEVLPVSTFLEEEYGYLDTNNELSASDVNMRRRRILRGTKRVVDSILAILIFIAAFPVFLLVVIAIYFCDGAPIFFRQKRLGKGGREFDIIKFRTMTSESNGNNQATKLGAILRLTHIDELPQLLNIIRGEMAIIGPRPEWVLLSTPELAPKEYWMRQAIRPGLTGWAQVCYKPSQTKTMRRRKLGYDLYYVNNRSIMLDLLIWFRTFQRLPQFFYTLFTRPFRSGSI